VDVYDAIPTIVTTFVAIIAKISIFIFLLELVYHTNSYISEFSWTYALLISSLLSLIIGTVVGLTQFRIKRLLAYSTIVRRCAQIIHGIKYSIQCSLLYPASRLGGGESPTLNLASSPKWSIRLIQICRLETRAALSTIKATLLEVYLKGSSTIGNCLDWYRAGKLNKILIWWILLWTDLFLGITNTYKSGKGQSKESLGIIKRTTGLPKVRNGYGNRGIVVPLTAMSSNVLKDTVALERVPGLSYCNFSSTAGDSSTVKSDAIRKLQWLENKCKNDANFEVKDIYNMMFNKTLYEIAYQKLKSKPGNMTQGITSTTLDGFSIEVIEDIVLKMKDNSFKFSPGRRVMIPKPSGGERPLTVAPPRDKIVQEVMRMILEVIYEPSFSDNSHGFRAFKSCHTAMKQIFTTFGVASWYIEGDISKCFDSFDHGLLIQIIRRRVKDERFVRLIIKAMKAGYFEYKVYKHSITGTPQGSIISPILCNIYLNEFDRFIEKLIETFTKGQTPRGNPLWISYNNKKRRAKLVSEKVKWHRLMLKVPSKDPMDPNFRKLVYVRYADDWILGIRGTYGECVNLLSDIKTFLKEELKLNLSENKTLITNADREKALFLGTHVFRSRKQVYTKYKSFIRRAGREIRLEAPISRISKKLNEAGFMNNDIATPRFLWLNNSKDQIMALYNSVYRGFINYYSFSHNLGSISGFIHSNLKSSCAKLLAAKFTLGSQSQVFKRFGKNLQGQDNIAFVEPVYKIKPWDFKTPSDPRINPQSSDNGIVNTLYAETISKASLENLVCAICDSNYRVEMHHIRYLKDLNPKVSKIDELMIKRRRKQIALCRACHMKHHSSTHSS
jgi:group II intron reverse transcriptase/maturase